MNHPAPLPAPCYQGSVNTWECDDGGHLNVRFHVERALIGLSHLACALKVPHAFTAPGGSTLAVRDIHMRFLKEARPGAPLIMHGGVVTFDDSEALLCLDMRHADGAPASVFTMRVAHVETRNFRAFPWSARTRTEAARLTCVLPPHAKPRTLNPGQPPRPDVSIAQANALGALRIGATQVLGDQCDAFGRLRGEHFIGRVSDSVPNLLAGWRQDAAKVNAGADPAGAVVEARLVIRRWPRAGELIDIYTGTADVGEKTFRLVHWLCDPENGAAWASMEAVALTFDTKTRKAIAPSPEARTRMQARVIAMSV